MSRLEIKRDTLRALFAFSGNQCAIPGCTHELVTPQGVFVGQICHIEAANEGAPRFNPKSTDENRRLFENLMVLCYKHHKETDDIERYSANTLREIKAAHESAFGKKQFKVDESTLFQIERDMVLFWNEVQRVNQTEHVAPDFAITINTDLSPIEAFAELYNAAKRIQEFTELHRKWDSTLNEEIKAHLHGLGYDLSAYEAVPYYKNPFEKRGWEIHNLGIPNAFTDLYMSILNTEIRYLEEYLKTHAHDQHAWQRFKELQTQLLNQAKNVGYLD